MDKTDAPDWALMPADPAHIDHVRQRCRRMVRRRAAFSAGVAAVPIPGVDVLSDLSLFKKLVDDVNKEFGLTAAQVERLQPQYKLIAYQAALGIGGMMVGKLVTRELLMQVFKRVGVRMMSKSVARVVPIAGQLASAAIGFTVFRKLGYQHVDACAVVARELLVARPA